MCSVALLPARARSPRRTRRPSRRLPHGVPHFAFEADLVVAPRRNRGGVGSIPTERTVCIYRVCVCISPSRGTGAGVLNRTLQVRILPGRHAVAALVGGLLHGKEALAGSTPVDGSILPPVREERGCARGERPVFQTVPGESDSRHPLCLVPLRPTGLSARASEARWPGSTPGGEAAGMGQRLPVGLIPRCRKVRWVRLPAPATAARLGDGRASYARARGFDSLRSDRSAGAPRARRP